MNERLLREEDKNLDINTLQVSRSPLNFYPQDFEKTDLFPCFPSVQGSNVRFQASVEVFCSGMIRIVHSLLFIESTFQTPKGVHHQDKFERGNE
jgi:hypothetical protein